MIMVTINIQLNTGTQDTPGRAGSSVPSLAESLRDSAQLKSLKSYLYHSYINNIKKLKTRTKSNPSVLLQPNNVGNYEDHMKGCLFFLPKARKTDLHKY